MKVHTPPLNTMKYLHRGGGYFTRPKVCNNSFIIHLHRISGEKKKQGRRKENEKKV